MKIRFFNLEKQYKSIKKEVLEITDRIFSSGKVLQGEYTCLLEKRLAEYHNLKYAVGVNSGTDALIFVLKSLNLPEGSRVAVTSLSFIASSSAIVNAGYVPYFVDVDKYYLSDEKYLIDIIRKRKVKAVILVHLFGQMLGVKRIYYEAKKRGVYVIEDGAQSLGAERNGYKPGKYSDALCMSFDPTKILNAYGSGGMVLTNNKKIYKRVKLLRYHGKDKRNNFEVLGFNSQIDEIQAGILLVKFKKLKDWIKKRNKIGSFYSENLKNYVKIPEVKKGNFHVYHKYVIRLDSKIRNKFIDFLLKNGIEVKVHYSAPLYKYKNMAPFSPKVPLKNVKKYTKEFVSLPIYPELKKMEQKYICETIKKFF